VIFAVTGINLEPEHDGEVGVHVSCACRQYWDLYAVLPSELEIADLHFARHAIKLGLRFLV